jgi:hypothetical protein
MVSGYFSQLHLPFSRERLEAYRPIGGSDLDLIANYLWNMALSEALYPVLQGLEVALRNSLHAAGASAFRNDLWFDTSTVLPLHKNERAAVNKAKDNLRRHRKPITAGRLVAELNFGFWTNLFNSPYEQYLWAPPNLGLLDATFPHVPRSFRSRKKLQPRLDKIRRLRNRVFHHEPIWNLPNLYDQHVEMIETIEWISPTVRATIKLIDRFPQVYQQGCAAYHGIVVQLVNTMPP